MTNTPELLAPAGTLAAGIAAFEAGADAVYAGLPRFNARERGENFSRDELLGFIEYAHSHRKKVYLTLNTLIKERELDEVAELASSLYAALPDAVLVQDLGVAAMLRNCFPELTLHASTQMGIHNLEGLEIAAKLGFKRVVLERQLTLEEVALLAAGSPVELEVFIHGALCCSLSGECLFSSWSGGFSGNRGKCKQPCRRRFYSKNGNGFFFSTADLCTAEFIPELVKMGIASFKIEGRLRQPDYVFSTVSAYRKLIDEGSGSRKSLGEARSLLAESCGRKWSEGYYSDASMRTLIQYRSLGASGVPMGQVGEVADNGFGFTATRRVHLGDRVRVQPSSGDEGPALTITKMFVNRVPSTVASAGDQVFVCCDKDVEYKGIVFKIGKAASLPEVRRLPALKTKLNAAFRFENNTFKGEILNTTPHIVFECEVELKTAEKRPLSAETVAKELAFRSNSKYASGIITASFGGDYFAPLSELKKLRNAFWAHVVSELDNVKLSVPGEDNLNKYKVLRISMPIFAPPAARLRETIAVAPKSADHGNPKARVAASIYSYTKRAEELILPDFCPPEKVAKLKKLIAEAVAAGKRRFRASSLFNFALLADLPGIEVVSGYGIPVCNSLAANLLRELGCGQVMAHVELEKSAAAELIARSPLPVELYRFGRIPLLSTRAAIPVEGEIKDDRNSRYSVIYDRATGLTRLYSARVLSIPRLAGAADFYDLTNAHWGARETGEFNFSSAWL